MKPKLHSIHTVTIRDFGIHGEGIGSIENFTVFVEGALPEEVIQIRVIEVKQNYAKGEMVKVVAKSPHRTIPICPVFETCGGCQIMHTTYQNQIKWKETQVKSALLRIGGFKKIEVFPIAPSPKPLYYRNKVQLPLAEVDGDKVIGLYAKRSHDVIDVKRCFIHNEIGESVYEKAREILMKSPLSFYSESTKEGELRHLLIRTTFYKEEVLLLIVTTKKVSKGVKEIAKKLKEIPHVKGVVHGINARFDNNLFPDEVTLLEGEGTSLEKVLGLEVELSVGAFFQVNLECAEKMYQTAFSLAGIQKGDRVLDAYCGIGLFALFLAREGALVTGVEISEEAILCAQKNAKRNSLKATFICGKAEEEMLKIQEQEVVFLNPPRKGCDLKVLESVIRMSPRKVIYTSCQPATLARDLKYLAEHGYRPTKAYPFDLFPQTMHVETVALLEKD